MPDPQEEYDEAMYAYTTGDYEAALQRLQALVDADPANFDAQLAVAMCHYRKGDFTNAIAEGHRAEQLRPNEQLVHTNLSLFYMRSGDKTTAEKHGLQARIAAWKQDMKKPSESPDDPSRSPNDDLQLAQPKPKDFKLPEKFPDMPWKKKGSTPNPSPTPPTP